MVGEHVARLGKNILEIGGLHEPQPDVTVDAAKSEVIDESAEGRNVRPFARIKFYRKDIVAVPFDTRRQLE